MVVGLFGCCFFSQIHYFVVANIASLVFVAILLNQLCSFGMGRKGEQTSESYSFESDK